MQTLTMGAYRAKLSPVRNVGELQLKLAKCTGKFKPSAIKKDSRVYPPCNGPMSTADYVRRYFSMNGLHYVDPLKTFEPLNENDCAVYTGEDLHEIIEADAPESSASAPEASADAVTPESAPDAPTTAPIVPDLDRVRHLIERFYQNHLSGAPGCTVSVDALDAEASHLRSRADEFAEHAPQSAATYREVARQHEESAAAKRAGNIRSEWNDPARVHVPTVIPYGTSAPVYRTHCITARLAEQVSACTDGLRARGVVRIDARLVRGIERTAQAQDLRNRVAREMRARRNFPAPLPATSRTIETTGPLPATSHALPVPTQSQSEARPCTAIYSDGSFPITRDRAAYLLRAARSRGPSNRPRRIGLHSFAIDGARLRIITAEPIPATQSQADPVPVNSAFETDAQIIRTSRLYLAYQYLPMFARLAIERMDSDSDLRHGAMARELCAAYAKTYGETCDRDTLGSVLNICAKRFWNYRPIESAPAEPDPVPGKPDSQSVGEPLRAEWSGFPVGGYYALDATGQTIRAEVRGNMPRRFKTAEAADAYARKIEARAARKAKCVRSLRAAPVPSDPVLDDDETTPATLDGLEVSDFGTLDDVPEFAPPPGESKDIRTAERALDIARNLESKVNSAAPDAATRARLLDSEARRVAESSDAPGMENAREVYRTVSTMLALKACTLREAIPAAVPRIGPAIRVPRYDPRVVIPARFAPGYALRG